MTAILAACPKGHVGDWYVPPPGSKGGRYCRSCKADRAKKRYAFKCAHPGPCQWGRDARGHRYCAVQKRQRFAALGLSTPVPPRVRKPQPPDGWEAEFGPVPLRVPSVAWVDRVALERRLSGVEVGRELTAGERRALELLAALRR